MAFFLLGRSEDGSLSLLSNATFESRQDALSELGLITGDASFDRWNDDVLLIDLDTATPVLLVRPTEAAPAIEAAPEAEPEPEAAVFAAIADDPADLEADEPTPEEPEAAIADEAAVVEPELAAVEPSAVEAADSADGTESSVGSTDVVTDSAEATGVDSLRDALARTTEQMEASGIVAPDSIGLAPVAAEDELPSDEPISAEPDVSPASEDVAAESATWPWATTSEVAPVVDSAESDALAADVSFVLEGLEEPAVDDGGSLITSSIDDEALAANRPVILGAYGQTPHVEQPEGPEEAEATAPEPEQESDVELTPPSESEPDEVDGAEPPEDTEEPAADSDFIVLDDVSPSAEPLADSAPDADSEGESGDLDAIEPTLTAPVEPTAADGADDVLALSSYVCDDCVYVDTCPNKDQRRPEDCGSFQWK